MAHRLALLAGLIMSTATVYGDIGVNIAAGYSVTGTLAAREAFAVAITPASVGVDVYLRLGSYVGLALGGVSHVTRLSFQDNGLAYAGSYSAFGGSGSALFFLGSNYQLEFHGEYLAGGVLSAKAVTKSVINGESFEHSTLRTYTGPGGILGRVAWVKEKTDGQLSRSERMRMGIALDVLQQSLSSEALSINTSNPSVGPKEQRTRAVGYSFTYTAVMVIVGFVM